MKTKLTLFVTVLAVALFGMGCASTENNSDPLKTEPKFVVTLSSHEDAVRGVAYSPAGDRIATCSKDKTIKIWNASDGRLIQTLKSPKTFATDLPDSHFVAVSWSPDGTKLAASHSNTMLWVWDTAKWDIHKSRDGNSEHGLSLDWSPDSSTVAMGCQNGNVRLVKMSSEGKDSVFKVLSAPVYGVSWSPDGKQICAVGKEGEMDGSLIIMEPENGKVLYKRKVPSKPLFCVSWSPDGKSIASGGRGIDIAGTINVWDFASGRELYTLHGHRDWVFSLAWSPDGKRIVSGSGARDKSVKIWVLGNSKAAHTLHKHTSTVSGVSWSPDGKNIVSGDANGKIIIWEAGK